MNSNIVISRRQLIAGSASLTASLAIAPTLTAATGGPIVVELFTSQGCSSCPPADALLGDLLKRPNLIALTFNVDYWDYLGWRDTLASAEYSRRQRAYAQARGDGQVYTPQMVIIGQTHVVGSRRRAVDQGLSASAGTPVPMTMAEQGNEVIVEIAARPDGVPSGEATIWIAMVVPQIDVEIARGENTGRNISYFNVARKLMPAGSWHGEAVRLTLPKNELFVDGATACAAILQSGGVGPILGAAAYGDIHGA